jgi:hypothetical protein
MDINVPISPFMRTAVIQKLEDVLDEEAKDRCARKLASLIYKAWYDAHSNPYHRLGRIRLLSEFDILINANEHI